MDQQVELFTHHHFGTIYDFLVSRKVFLKRVRDIEIIVDDQDLNLLNDEGSSDECWYESVEYTSE